MQDYFERTLADLGPFLLNLLGALAILIIGYIIAKVVASLVRKGLRRTTLDDRIANSLGGDRSMATEQYISRGIFYVIMAFVLVAFFNALDLTNVTEPFNRFLSTILEFIPQLIAAGILLLVAYVVASILRALTKRALHAAGVDERVGEEMEKDRSAMTQSSDTATRTTDARTEGTATGSGSARSSASASGPQVSETVATAVYYLVFLLFLPAILSTLELNGLLRPVENMVNEAMAFLPNLLGAALILVIGYFIARLVRRIVVSLSTAAGVDSLAERVGVSNVLGRQRLSQVLGTIVYVLILLPVIIAALDQLEVEAITAPASRMLDLILEAIPLIFAAALILTVAYVVGKLVAGLVANLLESLGFNRLVARTGASKTDATHGAKTRGTKPSDIAGTLVLVGIMLFAAMEAAGQLGFEALAALVAGFLVFAGQVVVGLIILALGVYLANLAYRAVASSRLEQAELLAVVARVAILVLAVAIALRQMGLANSIINLAFGLTLGAVAVAAAIAFGLGGRDFAKRQLERAADGSFGVSDALKPSERAPGMERGPRTELDTPSSSGSSSGSGSSASGSARSGDAASGSARKYDDDSPSS